MGAQQSSQGGTGTAETGAAITRKTCYYEVLAVDRSADDAEIRRAYKKKALELHPDRNYNDEENATKKFSEVQTAYEVLSDPQERAWYDSHRDAILRGHADVHADDAPPEHYNVRLTTTEDIMTLIGRFNSSVPFNDSPTGFFGILDVTFGQLATEEAAACEWDDHTPVEYPPFGSAGDDYDTVAKPFYNAWSNFSTKKSYSWKEKWRLADAPDRRVRRAMEKENKKMREDAIRDFNDSVRSLVAFVKKRDPRYVPNTQSEAERQKILRDSAAAQAERARAANQEKLGNAFVADWAQARGDDHDEQNDEFATSEDESEVDCFECVVCDKIFKSEKQLDAHEKSKKHIKAFQQLRRQMKKEGVDFDLDEPVKETHSSPGNAKIPDVEEVPPGNESKRLPATESENAENLADEEGPQSSSDDTLNDEYAPREVVEGRFAPASQQETPGAGDDDEEDGDDDLASKMTETTLTEDSGPRKMGKAKAKKARRAAKQAAQAQEASNKCAICDELFESRTKLFKHIKDEDHVGLMPVNQTGKKGKKSKR